MFHADRLNPLDLTSLWTDDTDWVQDVAALAVLDGPVGVEDVREAVAARLDRAPRLRQVLRVPRRGLGRPLWVDAPDFRIADHVRVAPSAADEAGLLAVVESLRSRPFDLARPLWQMWLVPGPPDGRTGLYTRVHHALVDGTAGVAMLAALLPPGGGPTRPWTAAPAPTNAQLFADNLRRCRDAVGRALRRRPHRGRHQSMTAAVLEMARHPAARTSLNRRVGPDRAVALVRCRLDRIREAAHRNGATVNDLLLAAITGGLRALLLARGERVEGLVLRALVPVSMHHEPGVPAGNVLGQIPAPLPVGEVSPAAALRLITAATATEKARVGPRRMPVLRSRALQRVFVGFMARQRMTTLTVADIPGPRERLGVAGASVVELFPLVPLIGNMTIGVGALSYAGSFAVAVVADPVACPDIDVFADALRATLDSLTASAGSARSRDQHDE